MFTKGDNTFQALLFGVNQESFCYNIGDTLDLAVNVSTNYFNGNYSVNVVIKEMRLADIDDEILFSDMINFDGFKSSGKYIAKSITPTREEVGEIYRAIGKSSITTERIINLFLKNIGYAKTKISLLVLEELKLIKNDNGKYYICPNTQKTNLINSVTFSKLTRESEQS